MDLISIYSEQTCGANCWLAEEDICKCSCSGKNHGIALSGGNPEKIIKIDGFRYKLFRVGLYSELYREAHELLKDTIRKTITCGDHAYTYHFSATEKGSPIRLKALNDKQKEWQEVKNIGLKYPYALWQKINQIGGVENAANRTI